MKKKLLEIRDLHVSVGDANIGEKEILHGVDLEIDHDETHVLMGPTVRANPLSDMPSREIPLTTLLRAR